MNIEQVDIGQIRPYERNPRRNKQAVETVKDSIREFGFKQPIVVDRNNVIVVGHTRYQAARELDIRQVPVVRATDLTESQVRAYRIMDNRSNENALWDDELLVEEFRALEGELALTLTGFTQEEIQFKLDESLKTEDERDNEVVEYKGPSRCQLNDLWILGNHKLYCGSSTDARSWRILCGDDPVRLVFTSPPYNMASGLYDEYADNKSSIEYIDFNDRVVECALRHLKGFLFYNISYNKNSRSEFIDILYNIKRRIRFIELIVWRKNSAIVHGSTNDSLTRKYEDIGVFATEDAYEEIEWLSVHTNVSKFAFQRKTKNKITNLWEIDNKNVQEDNHRAAFPVELPARGMRLMTESGDFVVDPFGGTGTTLIAAEKMGRRSGLIELSPVYCDQIIARWQQYTGQQARHIDGTLWDECNGS